MNIDYELWLNTKREIRFWRNSFIVFMALFIFTNIGWIVLRQESSQEAYERGYKKGKTCGCKMCIDWAIEEVPSEYWWKPHYFWMKTFDRISFLLDSTWEITWQSMTMQDTIFRGWHLPDPEISIEDDTIAIHAWDSLGYCVLTGIRRPNSTDTNHTIHTLDNVDKICFDSINKEGK